jgi:hypothetical protein
MTPGLLGSWKPGQNETLVPFDLAQGRLSTPQRFALNEQRWLRFEVSHPFARKKAKGWGHGANLACSFPAVTRRGESGCS